MVPPQQMSQLGPELPAVLPEKLFAGKSVRSVAMPLFQTDTAPPYCARRGGVAAGGGSGGEERQWRVSGGTQPSAARGGAAGAAAGLHVLLKPSCW